MNHIYMKCIAVILFSMFFTISAFSQKLTVESFAPAPMDLTASTSPVKDLNGKACGLIDVLLAADGATFEGNIIGEVKHKTSEYLVYMTDGSYRLKVTCPGYLPLMINFRDYGIEKILSNTTYTLTLLLPSANTKTSSDASSDNRTSNQPNGSQSKLSSQSAAKVPVPEAVDLGLSVKWASFNLGASKPEEYGNYYKWGETEPTDDKGWNTYKYDKTIYKGKSLKPEYDAASVNLGGNWRMPTDKEIKELREKCQCKWTTINGINGIRVTGANGNSIFLPASGYRNIYSGLHCDVGSDGFCWSSTPSSGIYGYNLDFDSDTWNLDGSDRANGFPVRPVLAE